MLPYINVFKSLTSSNISSLRPSLKTYLSSFITRRHSNRVFQNRYHRFARPATGGSNHLCLLTRFSPFWLRSRRHVRYCHLRFLALCHGPPVDADGGDKGRTLRRRCILRCYFSGIHCRISRPETTIASWRSNCND
jgi:hypothetical protein